MDFDAILEVFLPDDDITYWDDLKNHIIHVDCKTFPPNYAREKWGPDYASRTTKGKIRKTYIPRGKKAPWFEIFFEDTRCTYNKLSLEYVLKYSIELPEKYSNIKARYILELSKVAANEQASVEEEASAKLAEVEPEPDTTAKAKRPRSKVDSSEKAQTQKKGRLLLRLWCVAFWTHD